MDFIKNVRTLEVDALKLDILNMGPGAKKESRNHV